MAESVTLVTGASGFLGKAVMKLLAENSKRAIGLDPRPSLTTQVVDTLSDRPKLKALLAAEKITHIIHAGGVSGPMRNVLPGRNVVVNVKSSNHVVQHAELFEQADLLKGPGDSKSHAPMRGQGRKVGARERQRTGTGSVNTADEIEQRRFPCPVRTDDGEYRSGGDLERNVRHGFHAAEILVQALRPQDGAVGWRGCTRDAHGDRTRPSFSPMTRAACASPPGIKRTTNVSAAP